MQRNFIVFITLSILVLAGWTWLQRQIWPPPPPQIDTSKASALALSKLSVAAKEAVLLANLVAQPGLSLSSPAAPWSVAWTLERTSPYQPRPIHPRELLARQPLLLLPGSLAAAIAFNADPLWPLLAHAAPKADLPRPVPVEITLGGEGYHLEALLTTQGAGISRLTLRRFKDADWLGQPVDQRLDLLPYDPFNPSYVLYHYTEPHAKTPVLGLAEKAWKHDAPQQVADGIEVRFHTLVPDLESVKLTKVYTLRKNSYHIELSLEIKDERVGAGNPIPFRYQLVGAHGLPIEGEWYTSVFRNAVVGMVDNRDSLWRTLTDSNTISAQEGAERVPAADRGDTFLQYAGVVSQYFAALIVVSNVQPPPEEGGVSPKDILAWARATQETSQKKGRIAAVRADTLIFRETPSGDETVYTLLPYAAKHLKELGLKEGDHAIVSFYETPAGKRVATWIRPGRTLRPPFDDIAVRVHSEVMQLRPGDKVAHQFLLYHGPVKTRLLGQFRGDEAVPPELVDRYTDTLHLRSLTDYPSAGIGWLANKIFLTDLIIIFTRIMHWLLDWLHFVVPNFGLAIILLTVLVRGAMHPISRRQAYFSIKMQELAPEMKKLQERYKNDPQAKTQAVMELYRRHNVHPLGSCLPLIMQMPIFLGLYFALQESIHFRLAPFLWMDNLAAPDMLIWWTESIPYISDPDSQGGVFYLGPYLNLLPIIATALMVLQQQMMTPPPTDEQQAAQQKMMKYMTLIIAVLFYKVPSGLALYFIASSLWGVAERQLLPKKKPPPAAVEGAATNNGPQPKSKGSKARALAQTRRPPEEDSAWQKVKSWWAEVLKQAEKK